MEVPVADAIDALTAVVAGLLPASPDPAFAPDLIVNPMKSHASGIGGFVGLHPEPAGEIHARRLRAQIVIRVKANSVAALSAAESSVTNALLRASETQLRSRGVYRIVRDTEFGVSYVGADSGLAAAAGKDIRFDVDFEYRQLPEDAAGVIETVPLDLMLQTTDARAETLYADDFATDPLADFTAIDDGTLSSAGNWSYNSVLGRVEQTSTASGGNNPFNPNKRGTYLVLRSSLVARIPTDWILHAELGATSGGIGLVFNFRDVDNFYFFIMSQPTPYRLLGKKVGGAFSFLDVGGQGPNRTYEPGDHRVRLVQQDGELELALDGRPVLTARENAPPPPGSVGFLSRSCPTARFHSLRWLGL